ncbi:hypothetical protein BDV97DRAFT_365849 [Delphinella strobiligena]|nr:hypothetical protein BDV97DRAFT_365849 [Delphinella strobiligena]
MSELLTLPPELQNMIYEYALQSDRSVLIGSAKYEIPGLLRSCRFLRQRYSAMYYRNNIFEFETLQADPGGYVDKRTCKWLRDIPEEHLSMIKHIRLRYNLKVGTEQWILGLDGCIPERQRRRRKITLVRQYPDGSIKNITISSLRREVAISAPNNSSTTMEMVMVVIILIYLNMRLDNISQLDKSRLRTILDRVWLDKFNPDREQATEEATEEATVEAAEQAAEQAAQVRPSRRLKWKFEIKSCYRRLTVTLCDGRRLACTPRSSRCRHAPQREVKGLEWSICDLFTCKRFVHVLARTSSTTIKVLTTSTKFLSTPPLFNPTSKQPQPSPPIYDLYQPQPPPPPIYDLYQPQPPPPPIYDLYQRPTMATKLTLLTMPPEILNQIVGYCMLQGADINAGSKDAIPPNVLRTCKQLRNVYASMFYGGNTFIISRNIEMSSKCTEQYINRNRKWLDTTAQAHFKLLRNLKLGVTDVAIPTGVTGHFWPIFYGIHMPAIGEISESVSLYREYPGGECRATCFYILEEEITAAIPPGKMHEYALLSGVGGTMNMIDFLSDFLHRVKLDKTGMTKAVLTKQLDDLDFWYSLKLRYKGALYLEGLIDKTKDADLNSYDPADVWMLDLDWDWS